MWETKIKENIKKQLEDSILNDDFILKNIKEIETVTNYYYEITPDATFDSFCFISNDFNELENYKEKEQPQLKGFLFKLNINDNFFLVYQHKYSTTLINRNTSLFARLNGSVYTPLDCDVVKIDSRIDILIIDNSVITNKINLLQQEFGFEDYIRNKASDTIELITEGDIVSSTEILKKVSLKKKLTFAKKLYKAYSSPVFMIPKTKLIERLKKHNYYNKYLKFTEQGKIDITSEKDVRMFLKMLNDEILYSTLTEKDYDSPVKELLKDS